MFPPINKEEIKQDIQLKIHSQSVSKVILLMITDGEKWHYFGAENPCALWRAMTSKHNSGCYCIKCLHRSLSKTQGQENHLKPFAIQKICKIIGHTNTWPCEVFINMTQASEDMKTERESVEDNFDETLKDVEEDVDLQEHLRETSTRVTPTKSGVIWDL